MTVDRSSSVVNQNVTGGLTLYDRPCERCTPVSHTHFAAFRAVATVTGALSPAKPGPRLYARRPLIRLCVSVMGRDLRVCVCVCVGIFWNGITSSLANARAPGIAANSFRTVHNTRPRPTGNRQGRWFFSFRPGRIRTANAEKSRKKSSRVLNAIRL